MDISQLELLEVIVSCGSFKKAAEQCFVATSTLTRQVTAMEAEIGFPIFARSVSGVTLTEQGELFYQQTRGIAQLYQSAVESARRAGAKKQIIRVSIFGYTRQSVARGCEALKVRNPEIDFFFVSCRLRETRSALLTHAADLSLLAEIQGSDERLFELPVFRSCNAVIVPERSPLAGRESIRTEELDGQTILLGTEKQVSRNFREMRRHFEQTCPHSAFFEYQDPDQADALCQLNAYPIASLGFLEPKEGFRRLRLLDAPYITIGAACRAEDRARCLPLMEGFRDFFLRSGEYARAKAQGVILRP